MSSRAAWTEPFHKSAGDRLINLSAMPLSHARGAPLAT
jgi:hypothetical protein